MTEDLFEELQEEGEGERVDFKEFNYDFFNSDKKIKDEARASFIKDIFSFANTPKPYKKSAYIVLGVKDNGELVGLKSSIDGNIFQQKLELKSLGKIPRIHYHRDFPYREKIFGIIEIFPPESEKEPYISESDFTDKIKKGVLYFRRDNKNSEADEIETNNIKRWFYQCYERYEKNIQIPIGSELTNFPSLDLKNLVGRKQELKDVKNLLKQNTIVCITGISGQGKTTLARAYLSKNKNEYSKIIYLETDSSIQSAFLSSDALISNLKLRDEFNELSKTKKDLLTHVNISPKDEDKEKSHFELIMSKLRSLTGDNILVVDNINSFASSELSLLPKENWKILFTSKEKIENGDVSMYSLGTLSDIDSIELFKKHCDKEAKDDDLKILLTMIDYHALLIELTAKAISKSLEINSLQNFLDRIKKDVNDESLSYSFRIDHSKNQEVEFSNYIKQVFSISNIEKENSNAVYVLKMFLCFPSSFIEASEIMELLESGTLTKNQIGKSLRFLAEKGWLLNEKESFKMHPVIKLGINTQIQPSNMDIEKIIIKLHALVIDKAVINIDYAQIGLFTYSFYEKIAIDEKKKLLEVIFNSLEFLIENGKYQESLEYTEILLRNDYKKSITYFHRGKVYSNLGKSDQAIENYSKAIEVDQIYVNAYNNRGVEYSKLGQSDKAVSDYCKAIELNPNHFQAQYNRGIAYSDLGLNDKAIDDYSKIIELDPKFSTAYNNRGFVYSKIGQQDRAMEDYSKAIELDEKSVKAYHNRGVLYSDLGQFEKAIQDYSKAIELDAKRIRDYKARGKVYLELSQIEKAIADFTSAIEIEPNSSSAYYNRGVAYLDLGLRDKAIDDFTKIIENSANDVDAYYNRGLAYSYLDQQEKAIIDFRSVIAIRPNDSDAYVSLGIVYSDLEQHNEAIGFLGKAIEFDPKSAATFNYLGIVYGNLGDDKKAIENFTEAIRLDSNFLNAYTQRAFIFSKCSQNQEAIKDYTQAIEIFPNDVDSYFNRAIAYSNVGENEKAISDYTKAVEIGPDNADIYIHRGMVYSEVGEFLAELVGELVDYYYSTYPFLRVQGTFRRICRHLEILWQNRGCGRLDFGPRN
jgi:tetratricopeptide (TPR) repeat protein/ABC-type oligopeptide transport system ATPase subunit